MSCPAPSTPPASTVIWVEAALPQAPPPAVETGGLSPLRGTQLGVSQAPGGLLRAGTQARLLDKGVSQGGSTVGPCHQGANW